MPQVVEQAKALGAVRLQADTTTGNVAALAVLRDLGFTVTPDSRGHNVHLTFAYVRRPYTPTSRSELKTSQPMCMGPGFSRHRVITLSTMQGTVRGRDSCLLHRCG